MIQTWLIVDSMDTVSPKSSTTNEQSVSQFLAVLKQVAYTNILNF